MSAEVEPPGAGTPHIAPEPPVLLEPSDDPTVVTATYPAGEHLASIAQLLVGATELCTWQDVSELIPVRRLVHEVAWHLDRLVEEGNPISIRIAAAAGYLEIELRGTTSVEDASFDTWLVEEVDEVFDEVAVARVAEELVVTLASTWPVPPR